MNWLPFALGAILGTLIVIALELAFIMRAILVGW